jgi:hypothetical protein
MHNWEGFFDCLNLCPLSAAERTTKKLQELLFFSFLSIQHFHITYHELTSLQPFANCEEIYGQFGALYFSILSSQGISRSTHVTQYNAQSPGESREKCGNVKKNLLPCVKMSPNCIACELASVETHSHHLMDFGEEFHEFSR